MNHTPKEYSSRASSPYYMMVFLLVIHGFIGLSATEAARAADWYVSAQAGITVPQNIGKVEGAGGGAGVSVTDLELQTSIVYGGKLCVFFPVKFNWLGIEGELFNANPHLKQQTVTTTTAGGTTTGSSAGAHLRVTTAAMNVIIRYPGKTIQPYVGVGLGNYWFRLSDSTGLSNTETNVGFNGLAGVRYFFMDKLSIFTEYKYNYSRIKFTDTIPGASNVRLEGDYAAHHFVGGISFHFDGPS